jgi:RNA polymerase sigma-70 factor (ECF subfamily)
MQIETANFTEQDAQAVQAVRTGDAERYRELVERHERRVYAVAWSRLGDATLAEEATQEAFIRAYRRLWLLGDGAKFSGWIASIARHVAINFGMRHRRELSKRERWALEQTQAADSPDAEADAPCTPETLRHTLAELPAAHRECLVLFYLEGRSGVEAAATLGISEAALRVRLHRARAALRERLEARLGDSLQKLSPGKTLAPAVMAVILASSSAKAATAGGAVGVGVGANLLASFGKVIPFAALFPLLQIVASLPSLLLMSWIGRVERRNYRDPEGVRAQFHRGFYRSFLWGFPLLMILIIAPIQLIRGAWGMQAMHVWTVAFLLTLTVISARSLVINRNPFQIGSFVYCCVITVGMAALAVGWLPPTLGSLPIILATLVFVSVMGRRPIRMDYNLFLRASQGLLKFPDDEGNVPAAPRLDRAALRAFGQFLGSRWLAVNFRWETQGLALRLPPVKTRFLANTVGAFLPMSRGCSRLLLRDNGTVVAHLGATDAADLKAANSAKSAPLDELELQVAIAAEHAWHEFRAGNSVATERALGELPESEIFVVPPARARSTRWLRVWLGATVVLMAAAMILGWYSSRKRVVHGHRLQAVSFAEADILATLAQLGEAGAAGSNALRRTDMSLWLADVLPPKELFSSNAWQGLHTHLLEKRFRNGGTAAQRVDRLLGTPDLLKAVVNGWFGPEDFRLTAEEIRNVIHAASEASRKRWFVPDELAVASHADGKPAGYAVLDTESVARRLQCLKWLGCLDVVDGRATIELVLKHQVLSDALPAGRRQLPFPKLLHGTFVTFGQDPIRDTYHALVILDCLGALDRVEREACIQGVLRFHHGRGLFGSLKQGDGLVICGDSRDTFWAFESLRMLDALDRVRDWTNWQFRPQFVSARRDKPRAFGQMTWSEIEAWVCQQRFEQFLREQRENTTSQARSLAEPHAASAVQTRDTLRVTQ